MSEPEIFDRRLKRLQRKRASKVFAHHDFLVKVAASRLSERLNEEISHQFRAALDIGSRIKFNLPKTIDTFVKLNSEVSFLSKDGVCGDEELLPFNEESFDLITSILNLHWVNSFPTSLMQIRTLLKEKGLFLCSILGGKTLSELRQVINEVELETIGGISPRIAPMIETKDAGLLLQKTGFHLPVVDSEEITVFYPDLNSLVSDLRGMGETNSLIRKSRPLTKTLVQKIEGRYKNNFPGENKTFKATFEILTLTGWKS